MSQNKENKENIETFIFSCKISTNTLEYKCYKNEKEAYIESSNIDPNIYKSYFIILRKSIENLTSKGYEKIVQSVSIADWDDYLKDDKRWKIKSIVKYFNVDHYLIECNIEDAIGCISRGLGVL